MPQNFTFNKIYVIESLSLDETLTGTLLYNDLLRWKEKDHNYQIQAKLDPVADRHAFLKVFRDIQSECRTSGIYPIIHLEIHGSEDLDGLVLKSGELVTWEELRSALEEINLIVGNNLFLTLAVCHGAFLLGICRVHQRAPFWGFIGSFETIYSYDLLMRYTEFYTELLTSFEFDKALAALRTANPSLPADYRFINSQITFINVYDKYLREKASKTGFNKRKHEVIPEQKLSFRNRKEKRHFQKVFVKIGRGSREKYFREHSRTFFMLDVFPANKNRFQVGSTFKTSFGNNGKKWGSINGKLH